MDIGTQINDYINSQPGAKRAEILALHQLILQALPGCQQWFDNGIKDGKTVTNPTIGYGSFIIRYANGTSKEFFQIGLSGNSTGISVYILGIKDKAYLAQTYANRLGKAKVTGYCIRFTSINDIDLPTLETAIKDGAALSAQ